MLVLIIYTWKHTPYAVQPIPERPRELLKERDVKHYLSISGPSIVMVCADWWAYECIVILSSFLSVSAVAATAITYNYLFLVYQVPQGFQIGAVAVVGNIIGEEKEQLAKLMGLIVLCYATILSILSGLLTYFFSLQLTMVYTRDNDILFLVKNCMESLAFSLCFLGTAQAL